MITYTLDEIKHYWKLYTGTTGVRVLRDGKWHYNFEKNLNLNRIKGTRAEVVRFKDVTTFPKYLEKYGKK